jgi:soluble lytic murein transglycosylase
VVPATPASPDVQLEEALRAQHNGDYAQAIALYLALLDGKPAADVAREARYHLAESYGLGRDYVSASGAWEAFIAAYPKDARAAGARLMLARAYHQAGNCLQAVPQYAAYLEREQVLADLVHEWTGDCYAAVPNPASLALAIGEYREAIKKTASASTRVGLHEKIAGLYQSQSDYAAAVGEYDAILAVAKIEDYRAKIEYLAGRALAAGGQAEAAHARYLRAVNTYPKTEHAYLSLVELVNAGVAVDELQRGIIDYYAGKAHPEAYPAAIAAFDRYLAQPSAPKADQALYVKASAERAAEQPDAALASLERLLREYPQGAYADNAWLDKGVTYAWKGDTRQAVAAYQTLASSFPASELAPDGLMRAARLLDGDGQFVPAAAAYADLQARFPGYADADEALWRAGLTYYRAQEPQKAIAQWRALLDKYPSSVYRAKTLFWLGKLQARPASGPAYWDQVIKADPDAYYALRIGQLQGREAVTAGRMVLGPISPPAWDPVKAEREMRSWLKEWATLPAGESLSTVPVSVTRRLEFRRGEALLAAGMRREALAAFDAVRTAAWSQPASLASLALYWERQGLYGLAARASARLASLAPGRLVQAAPGTVQRLAYPLAYADLLSAEAQARSLDPLLLAALIRQESLFEPAAESYAGARGLGQVMPGTGQGIARSLKMADFELDDLYRPWVSVRFAAYYLAVQLNRFDRNILVALAAYNGGPGNTLHWLEGVGDDLDLFVEVIGATQSRLYLQRVYEQYLIYEDVYRESSATP